MSVRRARASDRAQVAEFKRALWSDDDGQDPAETVLVWESDGGTLGGFISVSVRPWAEGCTAQPVPYVEGWYVAEGLRRRGVGRALMQMAERWASERGYNELGSDVRVSNAASLRAHRRLGFVPTERLQYFRKALEPARAPRDQSSRPPGRQMQLRVARHTAQLDEIVAFYRDGLGLTELGRFRDHDGYDGVFLEVPGTGAHLEFTAGGAHGAPPPHPESLLVLYLGEQEAVARVVERLNTEPVAPAKPYWAEHGVTVEDPDGFRVVLVPDR